MKGFRAQGLKDSGPKGSGLRSASQLEGSGRVPWTLPPDQGIWVLRHVKQNT